MSDPAADPDARLHAALWRAVAAEGWHGLTMRRVAAEAGMAPTDLRRVLPTKLDALRLHGRLVDQEVLRGTPPGQGGTARDRIFDVLMRRLDALQPHRAGLLRFLHDLRRDPLLALALSPGLVNAMGWMLEAAEVDGTGPAGLLRAKGLAGVWLATLRAWENDQSADLGATMAALDRLLGRGERIAQALGLGDGAPAPAPG